MLNDKLTRYQNGVYYTKIKLFGDLSPTIKSLNHDIHVFISALKQYFLSHFFYPTGVILSQNS
jgi:hypothetical protein